MRFRRRFIKKRVFGWGGTRRHSAASAKQKLWKQINLGKFPIKTKPKPFETVPMSFPKYFEQTNSFELQSTSAFQIEMNIHSNKRSELRWKLSKCHKKNCPDLLDNINDRKPPQALELAVHWGSRVLLSSTTLTPNLLFALSQHLQQLHITPCPFSVWFHVWSLC